MSIDDLDYSELPEEREAAFVEFVNILNEGYRIDFNRDRGSYQDQNGNYDGSYEPERTYVMAVLAFIDEYDIKLDVKDISELPPSDFISAFSTFRSKLKYLHTRYKIRQNRKGYLPLGTEIHIEQDFKEEIGGYLNTIRKIVNQKIGDDNKKDKIFKKISNLQSEIDRDRTTIDSMFGRILDLSQTLGQSAESLEPAIDKMERIKKIFWDNTKTVEQLPKPNRPKMLPKDDGEYSDGGYGSSRDIDDEIPF